MTSPFSLLDFAPLDPTGTDTSRSADLANDGGGEIITAEGIEAAKEAFLKACGRGEALKADHIFLWLWDHVPAIEAFDLLMSVALPKNALDDHYFLFPGYLWRGLEVLGKEHLKVLFRPAVRYVARFPAQRLVPEADALIEEHNLLGRVLRQRTGDDETAKIGELGEGIRGCKVYSEIPKLIAQALADGLSLEGAGEGLSIGAAGLFLRSLTGNPMDVHLHTSANLRRYLLRLDGFSMKNKLLTLLLWHTGPEVKSTQYRMEATLQPDMDAVAALPHRSQEELLEAITQSIYNQPPTDWAKVSNLGMMRAVPEVKATVNLAQQYVNLRYDPQVLIDAPRRDRLPRQLHRDARLQAPPGGHRGVPQHARAVALDAPGVRLPGRGGLVRQEHDGLRGRAGADARRVAQAPHGPSVGQCAYQRGGSGKAAAPLFAIRFSPSSPIARRHPVGCAPAADRAPAPGRSQPT